LDVGILPHNVLQVSPVEYSGLYCTINSGAKCTTDSGAKCTTF
jgi:hypothetical protein